MSSGVLGVLCGGSTLDAHFAVAARPCASVTRTVSPGRDIADVAHDTRPIGVPADGVAARQDGERAERFEPAGAVRRAARLPDAGGAPSRPSAGRPPRRAASGCPPAGGPRSKQCELALQLLQPAVARGEAGAHHAGGGVRELGGVPAAHRDAARKAGERRPSADRVHAPAQALDARRGGGAAADRAADRSGCRTRPSPRRRSRPRPTASARAGRRRSRQS